MYHEGSIENNTGKFESCITLENTLWIWAIEAVEASEVAEADKVNEAGEVSKAWKITSEDFRVFQVLEFSII